MILHEDKKIFHSAIQMTAAALNIKPHFVEKDYWIRGERLKVKGERVGQQSCCLVDGRRPTV